MSAGDRPDSAASHETQRIEPHQGLKAIIDFAPLLLFFVAYFALGIYWATGILMAATVASLIASRTLLGHVSPTLMVTTVVVVGFGALTLLLNDPRFIMIKPTIVNLVFAAFLFGGLLLKRPVLQLLLGQALQLTDEGWRKLTLRWALFFFGLAVLNELVWRTQSTDFWVSFKVFGVMPLTFVFAALQYPLLTKYAVPSKGE